MEGAIQVNAQGDVKRAADGPPQLSVCIPTLNRADYLRQLLPTLLLLLRAEDVTFEIVVSDNCSDDATAEVLSRQGNRAREIVVVRPPRRTDHAEDNVLFMLRHAKGRYVWLLGDDDDIVPSSVSSLLDVVRNDVADLAVFNSRSHDFHGRPLKDIRIPCNAAHLDLSMADFVSRTGFWFVLSGFSTTVFRRENANVEALANMLAVSRIYSVVTWLVQQFWEARVRFVNVPLVSYRQNLSDVAPTADDIEELRRERERLEVLTRGEGAPVLSEPHWARVTRLENTFAKGVWTNKFLEQIDVLCSTTSMERTFLTKVVDRGLESRFVFTVEVLKHFVEQLERWERDGEEHALTTAQLAYFTEWASYLWIDQGVVPILLRQFARAKAQGDVEAAGRALRSLRSVLNELARRPWFQRYHVRIFRGYNLYAHGGVWAAVHVSRPDLAVAQFQFLDPSPVRPFLLTASSEEALLSEIERNCSAVQNSERLETVRVQNAAELANAVGRLGALLVAKLDGVTTRMDHAAALASRSESATSTAQKKMMSSASQDAQASFAKLVDEFQLFVDRDWYAKESETSGDPRWFAGADPFKHFEQVGSRAGRDPNPWFDESWYLARYPDAFEAAGSGRLVSGFHHFLASGLAERRDPSVRFSESAYLEANPDVAAAVADPGNGLRCGFEHWLVHGSAEGRDPLGKAAQDAAVQAREAALARWLS